MMKIFKKHIVLIFALLFVLLDVVFIVFSTMVQMSYEGQLPGKIQAVNLIAENINEGQFYFMNGEGDIGDEAIIELLKDLELEKQSKTESYKLLFSLRKKDFVLLAKNFNAGTNYVSPNIFVYVKNETVYIMYLYEDFENPDKCEFAFYIGNAVNSDDFSQYKAVENKYYSYYPSWINNLCKFNIRGKMYILCLFAEVLTVIVICKKRRKISK